MIVCTYKTKKGEVKAIFHGVYQRSEIVCPSLMLGGHPGGVVACPVAVIERSGKLEEVDLCDIKNIREV
ncbi:MAG: hypothetical protein HXM02_09340 [[Eubacterium] sulci]|nr:hypothetical protein [[Eubacterium] sulci]